MHSEFTEFVFFLSTARVLLVAVRRRSDRSWQSDDFLGPVSDTGARGLAPTPGFIPSAGPLAD